MAVNTSKCKIIIFHNKGKKINNDILKVYLNFNKIGHPNNPDKMFPLDRISTNDPVPENRCYKYLGILLDEQLSFNSHIDHICKKLSKGLFCLNRAKNFLPKKCLRTLYFSVFHSHLLYCSLILGCTSSSNIKKILTLQKKAIRSISHAKYNDHTHPLFSELKILPFDKILLQRKLLFMHGIIYEYGIKTFEDTWPMNNARFLHQNLRNEYDLTIPQPNFEGFKKFPLYDFAKTWNELGPMKYQQNPTTFKIWLKDELFRQLNPD